MPAGFVYRQGRKLYIDGQEWRFVGTNDFSLTGCHWGYVPTATQVDDFFAQFKDNKNIVIRIWGFQHLGAQAAVLARMDLVVEKAEKYGVKVTFPLHEGAENCNSPNYDQAFYQSGYQSTLLPWVDTVVSRYKNSPAIAFWEVSNEAFLKAPGTVAIAKAFLDGVAARIKQNSPDHLVGSGWLASTYGVAVNAAGYQTIHSGPDIDLCSIHEYDYGYTNGSTAVSPHWVPAADAAYALNKPAYVGEMGVSKAAGTTPAQRATDMKAKFNSYFSQPANRLPAGVLYWCVTFAPNSDYSTSSVETKDMNIGGAIIPAIAGYTHANIPKIDGSNPPTSTATTTSLVVSPTSSAAQGATITLTATVAPSGAAGAVQFRTGGTMIGNPITVSGGVVSTTTNTLPAGNHSFTAVFTPTDTAAYTSSTSDSSPFVIHPTGVLGIYNDDDAAWNYSSGWTAGTGTEKYNNDDHYTGTAGASATITISGPATVNLYGSLAPHHGDGTIRLSDASNQTVSTDTVTFYGATRQDRYLVWQKTIPSGNYTITLTSTTGIVTVDYLMVQEATSTVTTLPPIRNEVEIIGADRLSTGIVAIHHGDNTWELS